MPIRPTISTSADLRASALACSVSALPHLTMRPSRLKPAQARVDLCFRRAEMPRINPLIWMNFAGMFGHFAELADLERWRFMRHILEELPVPPTQDAFWRCRSFENFAWHADCAWNRFARRQALRRLKPKLAPLNLTSSYLARVLRPTFRPARSLPRSFTTLPSGATGLRLRPARKAICSHDILISAQHLNSWNGSPEPHLSWVDYTISPSELCPVWV